MEIMTRKQQVRANYLVLRPYQTAACRRYRLHDGNLPREAGGITALVINTDKQLPNTILRLYNDPDRL